MWMVLACPSALLAEEPAAKPVIKQKSEKARTRSAAKPDPSKIVKKPNPTVQSRVAAEGCTPAQEEQIETARKAAAIRTQTATDRARGLHPSTGTNDQREAESLAAKLIDDDLDFEQVVEISEKIRNRVSNADLPTACASAEDTNCTGRAAYVLGTSPPIQLCPGFFAKEKSSPEQRIRTLIHESAHLVGVREESGEESYCGLFDCEIRCGNFYAADGWAHFMHCLSGSTPDKADLTEE